MSDLCDYVCETVCDSLEEPQEIRATGLGLLSPNGILPEVVQTYAPQLYQLNNDLSEDDVGSKKVLGYPVDPSYPSDTRSEPLAMTPLYRGGQNDILIYLDRSSFHGVNGNNTGGGVYYDWDGVTTKSVFIVNTATDTERAAFRSDWYNWLFPQDNGSNYVMRGLKQLYEEVLPFADEYNPTVKEFEDWNVFVINHFRMLLGLNAATPSQSLFIQATWSDERKDTSLWDGYTGTYDSAYGPCLPPGANLHCGATFYPSTLSDQSPYWNLYNVRYPTIPPPALITPVGSTVEGIGTMWNGNAMTAMSRIIRNLVNGGTTSGHASPLLFRPSYGYSISNNAGRFRSKWTGTNQLPPSGFIVA